MCLTVEEICSRNSSQSTRITSHSNAFIENSKGIDPDIILDNLTATISYHLPRFAVNSNKFTNISGHKSNIYEREWSRFDRENFIIDYFSVDWEDLLKIDELNTDNSTKMYLYNVLNSENDILHLML